MSDQLNGQKLGMVTFSCHPNYEAMTGSIKQEDNHQTSVGKIK
jgi:hypothetical protein